MVVVPEVIPVKTPEVALIVATDVLEDDHEPPEIASVNVIFAPAQTVDGPEIAEVKPLTVI